MPNYKLTYFAGRGRAEPARFLFAQAGIKFEDNRVTHQDWPSLKSKTPMGQLPVLEVDGKQLTQSITIIRFLAREFGLAGDTTFDQAQADMYVDGFSDMYSKFTPYIVAIFSQQPEDKKKEIYNTFKTESYKPFLDRYEKFLASNGTGYLVGKKLTWADIVIGEWNQRVTELFDPEALSGHPKMSEHTKMVSNLPNISKYIASRPKTPL